MLKSPWEPKAILKKKNNASGIIMLGLKTDNRAIVLKTYSTGTDIEMEIHGVELETRICSPIWQF